YIEKGKIFVLSGPNFAIDIAKGMPSTTSLSYYYHQYRSYESAIEIKKILSSQKMKLHLNSDPMGSQLCGLMKNIYAILIGIIRGSDNDSENTVAMIILEAIKEIKFFLKKMNYDASIIDEPCGIGDLFMTCNSRLSRNMSLGYKIGKGEEIDYSGLMPEGYYAVDIIAKDNLPICKVVHQILYPEKYSEKNDYQTLLNKLYEVL
ncbi:MAG: hypothetical protein OEZ01_13745, partial [Candidatus Heimdallarchaeota archaeon]|nr:hypothetical protein [Candidatus Heimdallarchaeota archaeon]